jgi:hypothetical protein
VQTVADPTGSGRGNVVEASVEGPLPVDQGERKRRAQPERDFDSWENPGVIKAPVKTGVDVWLSRDLAPNKNKWVDLMSLFSTLRGGAEPHLLLTIDLWGDNRLHVGIAQSGGEHPQKTWTKAQGTNNDFTLEAWHTLEVVIDANGSVVAYLDKKPIGYGSVPSDVEIGFFGVRTGLYCGTDDASDDFAQGAYMLKDNHSISVGY